MAAKKRTPHQREKDLAELSRLDTEGLSQKELAAHFKVSERQIRFDLETLDERFREEQVANVARRKRRRHNELEKAKRLALEAFERSRQDAETLHAETTKGRTTKTGDPLPDLVRTTKTMRGQAGDAALLEKYLKAVAEQIDLWGDAAPTKIAPTNPEGDREYDGGGTGALLAALLRAAGEAAATGDAGGDATQDTRASGSGLGVTSVGADAGAAGTGTRE